MTQNQSVILTGMVQTGFGPDVAKTADVSAEAIVVHDAQVDNPASAVALSRLSEQNLEYTAMGVDSPW
jgi:2-oxoglutarate ferredoxin oxidoreductase subunit beta